MSKKIVYSGQSFLDKVLETTGSIENAFEMTLLNEFSITDDLAVGTELKISKITNKSIANYFDESNRPASALTTTQLLGLESLGIGSMIIETNFIVQ
jgi:hypothetical protein